MLSPVLGQALYETSRESALVAIAVVGIVGAVAASSLIPSETRGQKMG